VIFEFEFPVPGRLYNEIQVVISGALACQDFKVGTVEHDIVLTQEIIFDYLTTGKKSPVLK